MSAGVTEMVAAMMNYLSVLGRGPEALVEDLEEGDFRRLEPRLGGMAGIRLQKRRV